MKKVLCIAISALVAVSVAHADEAETTDEPGRFGVGYQGVVLGGGEFAMDQLSLRLAPQPFGGALVIGHLGRDRDGGNNWSYWEIQAKGFYTLIDRENSDFYVGASTGIARYESDSGGGTETDYQILIGALAGLEWYFAELPEIGFNFELGYNIMIEDNEVDANYTYNGIFVSLGANYYF